MTPPRRKTAYLVAGYVGAIGAGFASHWVVPLAGNAAQAAPESGAEARLRAVETKTDSIISDLASVKKILGYLECRSNVNNVCPPPEAK